MIFSLDLWSLGSSKNIWRFLCLPDTPIPMRGRAALRQRGIGEIDTAAT